MHAYMSHQVVQPDHAVYRRTNNVQANSRTHIHPDSRVYTHPDSGTDTDAHQDPNGAIPLRVYGCARWQGQQHFGW